MKYFKTPHDRKPQPKNAFIDGKKICNKCSQEKLVADFARNPGSSTGYAPFVPEVYE